MTYSNHKIIMPVISIVMLMTTLLSSGAASGQTGSGSPDTITISGTVTDTSGEPVIGAGVQIKGTSTGTVTDLYGKFSLLAGTGATVIVSCIGYSDNTFEVTPPPKHL